MITALEPLSRLPGVEIVLLIAHDGVPIACAPQSGGKASTSMDALAALAASWMNELTQAVAPLSWNPPERILLRAARGTLVVRRSESACLVVLMSREASPEDVRLSMDGTLARIERARQGRSSGPGDTGGRERASEATPPAQQDVPGPIPSRDDPSRVEEGFNPASQRGQPPGS